MSDQYDNLDRLSNALAAAKDAMLTIRQIAIEGFPTIRTMDVLEAERKRHQDRANREACERVAAEAEVAALKKELEETQECFSLARGELYAIKTTPTERNGANICGHDRSWITCFGTCMACRAEKAETQAVAAEAERDALKKELEIALGERNAAIQSLKIIMENADMPVDGDQRTVS